MIIDILQQYIIRAATAGTESKYTGYYLSAKMYVRELVCVRERRHDEVKEEQRRKITWLRTQIMVTFIVRSSDFRQKYPGKRWKQNSWRTGVRWVYMGYCNHLCPYPTVMFNIFNTTVKNFSGKFMIFEQFSNSILEFWKTLKFNLKHLCCLNLFVLYILPKMGKKII